MVQEELARTEGRVMNERDHFGIYYRGDREEMGLPFSDVYYPPPFASHKSKTQTRRSGSETIATTAHPNGTTTPSRLKAEPATSVPKQAPPSKKKRASRKGRRSAVLSASHLDKPRVQKWASKSFDENPELWGNNQQMWQDLAAHARAGRSNDRKKRSSAKSAAQGVMSANLGATQSSGAGEQVRLVRDAAGQWVEEIVDGKDTYAIDARRQEATPVAGEIKAANGDEADAKRNAFMRLYEKMHSRYEAHQLMANQRLEQLEKQLKEARSSETPAGKGSSPEGQGKRS
jgi:hypothetical protein